MRAEVEHMRSMVADVKLRVRGCQGVPCVWLYGLLGASGRCSGQQWGAGAQHSCGREALPQRIGLLPCGRAPRTAPQAGNVTPGVPYNHILAPPAALPRTHAYGTSGGLPAPSGPARNCSTGLGRDLKAERMGVFLH